MELDRLLQSIGKAFFVEYYDLLKNELIEASDVVERLPNEYTIKSRRYRTFTARRIFKENLEMEALKIIIGSERLRLETVEKAKDLLKDYENKHTIKQ